jgi:hypothetical protein
MLPLILSTGLRASSLIATKTSRSGRPSVASEEDDRDQLPVGTQWALEVKPALAGEAHIQDETERNSRAFARQEGLHALEGLDRQAGRSKQGRNGLADRRIVVDDIDKGNCFQQAGLLETVEQMSAGGVLPVRKNYSGVGPPAG